MADSIFEQVADRRILADGRSLSEIVDAIGGQMMVQRGEMWQARGEAASDETAALGVEIPTVAVQQHIAKDGVAIVAQAIHGTQPQA